MAEVRGRARSAPRPTGAATRGVAGKAKSGSVTDARVRANPTGKRTVREPRLQRSRPRAVIAATTGLLGISSTRRAAVLAIVLCALALTVVVPLRNYVAQQQELAAVSQQQRDLAAQVEALTAERARLSDPAEIESMARSRLGYARPGEVPYVVQQPSAPTGPADGAAGSGAPWYSTLWHEVTAGAP